MKEVPASEFLRNTALYQDAAMVEPLTITSHGRPRLVLMSVEDYKAMRRATRQALNVTDLSGDMLKAIAEAKVPDEYAHLDDEME